jgi:hypothetical protein
MRSLSGSSRRWHQEQGVCIRRERGTFSAILPVRLGTKPACPGDFLACSALLTKTQGDTNALTSVINVTCPPSCYVGRRTFCQSISYSWSENATAASWQITLVPFFQCFTSSFNKTRVWLEREAHTPWLLLIRHSHGRKRITARKLSQQISSIQRGRAMR